MNSPYDHLRHYGVDLSDADLERLWDEFHQAVNMSADELRTWLLTMASGEDSFPSDPDLDMPELGRHLVRILGKRKRDLTADDIETMRQVVGFVRDQLEQRPPDADRRDDWRRALMAVGHDPLKPSSPRGEDTPPLRA